MLRSWCACRSRRCATWSSPLRGAGLPRPGAGRPALCATRRGSGLPMPCELHETAARLADAAGAAARVSLPSDRVVRQLCRSACAPCHGSAAAAAKRSWSGSRGCSTCCSSIRSRRSSRRFVDPARAWRASGCGPSPCCGSFRPAVASAPTSSTAIRAWCGSIRAGITPRCDSCKLGFRHILDGIDHLLFLLCLVIPLRRHPSADRRSSPRSPSRTRSR